MSRALDVRLRSLLRRNPTVYRAGLRARVGALAVVDAADRLLGRRSALVPPRRFQHVGGGDFETVGRAWVRRSQSLAGLRADEAVLDVGCGVGRVAIPLTEYLGPEGSYRGFDVTAEWVDWCASEISSRYPSFRFDHADVRNEKYNPHGAVEGSEYRFPYEAGTFTFALAASVFTHLTPPTVDRYLGEVGRVLSPGGRLLATFFLLEEAPDGEGRGPAEREFPHAGDGYRYSDPALPELAVAYDERTVRELMGRQGLEIVEPIHRGRWTGRPEGPSHQDIVVARRAG